MTSSTTVLSVFAGILALISLAIYIFGIPAEWKREMEKKALKTMGENKASYMLKDQLGKVPTTDDRDVNELKNNLGNTLGGALKNPIGEQGGELGDKLTSPFTGR